MIPMISEFVRKLSPCAGETEVTVPAVMSGSAGSEPARRSDHHRDVWPEATFTLLGAADAGEVILCDDVPFGDVLAALAVVDIDADGPALTDELDQLRAILPGSLDLDEESGADPDLLDRSARESGLIDLALENVDRLVAGWLCHAVANTLVLVAGGGQRLAERGRRDVLIDQLDGRPVHHVGSPDDHVVGRRAGEFGRNRPRDRTPAFVTDSDALGRLADQRRANAGSAGETDPELEVRHPLGRRAVGDRPLGRGRHRRREQGEQRDHYSHAKQRQPPVRLQPVDHRFTPRLTYQRSRLTFSR